MSGLIYEAHSGNQAASPAGDAGFAWRDRRGGLVHGGAGHKWVAEERPLVDGPIGRDDRRAVLER